VHARARVQPRLRRCFRGLTSSRNVEASPRVPRRSSMGIANANGTCARSSRGTRSDLGATRRRPPGEPRPARREGGIRAQNHLLLLPPALVARGFGSSRRLPKTFGAPSSRPGSSRRASRSTAPLLSGSARWRSRGSSGSSATGAPTSCTPTSSTPTSSGSPPGGSPAAPCS
jgi:hypothetical protein